MKTTTEVKDMKMTEWPSMSFTKWHFTFTKKRRGIQLSPTLKEDGSKEEECSLKGPGSYLSEFLPAGSMVFPHIGPAIPKTHLTTNAKTFWMGRTTNLKESIEETHHGGGGAVG